MHESRLQFPVRVTGTGSYLPEKVLSNRDLEKIVDTTDEWITTRTGIKERRIASETQATSDLAAAAGKAALEEAGVSPEEIDLIIVATITPDMAFPATACFVQTKLGCKNAASYDISAACSGFVYGIQQARLALGMGRAKHALIIGAEKLSSLINWEDRNTCVLFGDGAGACVLSRGEEGDGLTGDILSNVMRTQSECTDILLVPGSGTSCHRGKGATEAGTADRNIFMAGQEVFKNAVTGMIQASQEAIQRANLEPEDITALIPHQANLRIIDAIRNRLSLPLERTFVNVNKYGNTSAASVAIALDEAWKNRFFDRGDHIVLVVFGAGLTCASCVIRW